jgi:hypothetical protein
MAVQVAAQLNRIRLVLLGKPLDLAKQLERRHVAAPPSGSLPGRSLAVQIGTHALPGWALSLPASAGVGCLT